MTSLLPGYDSYTLPHEGRPARREGIAESSVPLSFAQLEVWTNAERVPDIPLYNRSIVLERRGSIDSGILERSFHEIARRHDALRMVFAVQHGNPVQVINDNLPVRLSFADLSSLPEKQRTAEIERVLANEVRRPFNLTEGPLMRGAVFQLAHENHLLVLTVHALIADEWSLRILALELVSFYEAYCRGETPSLSFSSQQYADYAQSQRSRFQGDALEAEVRYWRERLAGIPPSLELPIDRLRPTGPTFCGGHRSLTLPRQLTKALEQLSEREAVPLFVTLLSAFQILLSRYTGQHEIITSLITPGRDGLENEHSIGPFANTVAVRSDLEANPTFRRLLSQINHSATEACEHQHVPFDRVAADWESQFRGGRNSVFQTLFSISPSISLFQTGWEFANVEVDTRTAEVDLHLQVCQSTAGMQARFIYSTDLFDAATIERISRHYDRLLHGIVDNPDQCLSKLPFLSDAERHQVLVEWNNTNTDYGRGLCIHQLFEEQVDRTPKATAVVFENDHLTYEELNRRSNQLAHHLAKLGVGPEVLVGICLDRSLDMVVALLGILKAGAAYVPLDPAYPSERISLMVEDAEVVLLLTERGLAEALPQTSTNTLFLDTLWDEISKESAGNTTSRVGPQNLAYVIYTSGSTGKPKGVQIQHGAVVNFLSSMRHSPGIASEDRLLAITTLSFDIAGLEIYLPLSVGASVEVLSRDVASDGERLGSKLTSSRATVLQATPATWRMLLEAGWEGNQRLKALCGGEAWSRSLADELLQRTGSLWNMYGPTETTIWSTLSRIDSGTDAITIGRPIANTQIFILDKHLEPVPVGVPGELYIGGEGLARGYLKRPELTAEKFIASPFHRDPQARLYKTGDLARYRITGEIEFLGRIDQQVKIRGFRIEVGEIEAALRRHDGVNEAIVVARKDSTGEQRLIAYFVPASETAATVGELRAFATERLPPHMVPSVFVVLQAMPLTPNGKIDRRALPQPDDQNSAQRESFVAPTDELESQLSKIWESVLGARPVGLKHNFFELGGHSLMAVRLMHRVEQAFGTKLPIATLFQAPTVEQLARILRLKGWSSPWSSLVPIQTSGSKPPLFCAHGIEANVVRFRALAQYLGLEQPFYGLQAQGVNEKSPCHTRTEEMAAHYIKEIRSVRPKGPYFIGGYSFGGMIALEIAQQLLAEGEEPSWVILFDTPYIPVPKAPRIQTVACVTFALLNIFRAPLPEMRASLLRLVTAPVRAYHRWLHVLRLPRDIKRVRKACIKAAQRYRPRPYPGRIILFRSTYKPIGQRVDPYAGWSTYADHGLETYHIEANHENILLEPQVRSVAEQLRQCLKDTPHPKPIECSLNIEN